MAGAERICNISEINRFDETYEGLNYLRVHPAFLPLFYGRKSQLIIIHDETHANQVEKQLDYDKRNQLKPSAEMLEYSCYKQRWQFAVSSEGLGFFSNMTEDIDELTDWMKDLIGDEFLTIEIYEHSLPHLEIIEFFLDLLRAPIDKSIPHKLMEITADWPADWDPNSKEIQDFIETTKIPKK